MEGTCTNQDENLCMASVEGQELDLVKPTKNRKDWSWYMMSLHECRGGEFTPIPLLHFYNGCPQRYMQALQSAIHRNGEPPRLFQMVDEKREVSQEHSYVIILVHMVY